MDVHGTPIYTALLLFRLAHLMLSHTAQQGGIKKDTVDCTLSLFLYADGYDPRGRSMVNSKVAFIDLEDRLLERKHKAVPACTQLLSCSG